MGRLVRRYKRFLADIETPCGVTTIHCPNTGAMSGCAEPGSEVWYSRSDDPRRKYPHTLEVVCTERGRVGVNTARANRLIEEALLAGRITELGKSKDLRREAPIPEGDGRFDFATRVGATCCYVEVKNLTLGYPDGWGAFPDAVSERAVKHVQALARRARAGDRAVLIFCVQHSGIERVTTADDIHPQYGLALRKAVQRGVEVLAYGCHLQRDCIEVRERVPFEFKEGPSQA